MKVAKSVTIIIACWFSFSSAFDPLDNYDDEIYYSQIFEVDSAAFSSFYFIPTLSTTNSNTLHMSLALVYYANEFFYRHDGKIIIIFSDELQYHLNYRVADSPAILDGYLGINRESIGNIRGDVASSGITYESEHLLLAINKARIQTSHFGENLLVNRYHSPTENIIIGIRNNHFSLESMIMILQPNNLQSKSLTYHRYGYTRNNFKFGFSEVSVLSYDNIGSISYKYFMPYSFLYEVEENYVGASNIFWRFDLSHYWGNNYFWTEFLIDDYAIDNESPPKTAFLIGLKIQPFEIPFKFSVTKVNRWVYNYGYDKPEYRFTDNGTLLGNPIGPDALKISISSSLKLSGDTYYAKFFPEVNLYANGEGSLFENTPVPATENFGYSEQDFLTGDVVYTIQFKMFGIFHYGNNKLMLIYDNNNSRSRITTTFEYHFSISSKK